MSKETQQSQSKHEYRGVDKRRTALVSAFGVLLAPTIMLAAACSTESNSDQERSKLAAQADKTLEKLNHDLQDPIQAMEGVQMNLYTGSITTHDKAHRKPVTYHHPVLLAAGPDLSTTGSLEDSWFAVRGYDEDGKVMLEKVQFTDYDHDTPISPDIAHVYDAEVRVVHNGEGVETLKAVDPTGEWPVASIGVSGLK
jgi:hypothetical protein